MSEILWLKRDAFYAPMLLSVQ